MLHFRKVEYLTCYKNQGGKWHNQRIKEWIKLKTSDRKSKRTQWRSWIYWLLRENNYNCKHIAWQRCLNSMLTTWQSAELRIYSFSSNNKCKTPVGYLGHLENNEMTNRIDKKALKRKPQFLRNLVQLKMYWVLLKSTSTMSNKTLLFELHSILDLSM